MPTTASARLTGTLVEHGPIAAPAPHALALPLVAAGNGAALTPLTTVRSTQPGPPLALTLAARASVHGLALRVVVADTEHVNLQAGSAIWDGDALQLALHALRPGEALGEVQGEAMAPGDLDIALGLGVHGPEAWLLRRGGNEAAGPYPAAFGIVRDEGAKTTTYTLEVPWHLLHASAETLSAVGIGLQLNDAQKTHKVRHLVWGISRAGGFRPSSLMPIALVQEHTSPQLFVREASAFGEFGVAAAVDIVVPAQSKVPHACSLELRCPGQTRTWPLSMHPTLASHATLELNPAAPRNEPPAQLQLQQRGRKPAPLDSCVATLRDCAGHASANAREVSLHIHDEAAPLRDVERRIGALNLAAHAHLTPRAVRHLGNLERLWRLASADAKAAAASQPQLTWDLLPLAEAVREQLALAEHKGFDGLERALRSGQLPALELLRSSVDGSWQPYVVQLPPQHEGKGPPPAVLFLHGKGSPSLSRFMAKVLSPDLRDLGGMAWIVPWARGNASVVGAAEQDVLDMLAELTRTERVDADRLYLLGFSMGATGALNLALHNPDPFAAVGLISGGSWEVALGHGLGDNVRGLPFYLWHGQADSVVPPHETERVIAELSAAHVPFEAHFAAGVGHTFTSAVREQVLRFFAAHRRVPNLHWRYVSDGPHHRGRSGVQLHYDAATSPFPSVSVAGDAAAGRIELQTSGTDGLEVDLGKLVGDASGALEVWLNRAPAYRGPAVPLTFGSGAPRP